MKKSNQLEELEKEVEDLVLKRRNIYNSVDWKRYREIDYSIFNSSEANKRELIEERRKIFSSFDRGTYWKIDRKISEILNRIDEIKKSKYF